MVIVSRVVVPPHGLEPRTYWLQINCSTSWATRACAIIINYFLINQNILNFYNKDTIVPYHPVAAKGPWIVASNGALLYDVGGYGMLGFGHSPDWCLEVLSKTNVMANIMTPNSIQLDFTNILQEKII